jgi:hypothetical protein
MAEQPPKPVCNAQTRGQFWPDEANHDQEATRQLYQRGELEMCSKRSRKFEWQHLSVDVRDLLKRKPPSTSASGTASTQGSK